MKRQFWRLVGICIFALAGLGSINLGIWVVDREPPIIYEDAKALSPTVEQGGTIEIEFSVFRTRICPLIAKRWLIDSTKERHSIPQFTTGLRLLAGRETYRRSITVPVAAAPGPAEYRVTLEYVCNPLQKFMGPIVVASPPVKFDVLQERLVTMPPT